MAILIAFAFLSGVITILSPCILPVLPILLSGGVSGGRARPFGVVSGFVASFTVFTLALSAVVQALGIPADALRIAAVALIVLFGLVMLIPRLAAAFELLASRAAAGGRRLAAGSGSATGRGSAAGRSSAAGSGKPAGDGGWAGYGGGCLVGLSLGLVWTPCVGPIMASVISLALTRRVESGSVWIALAYSLGTALPMLGVMFGGRALLHRVPALARNAAKAQRAFGALMILVGVAIGLGWDRRFQSLVLRALPNYGAGLTAVENIAPVRSALRAREGPARGGPAEAPREAGGIFTGASDELTASFGDYGLAPEFPGQRNWFNTEGLSPASGQTAQGGSMPLTLAGLRSKVVVVDFWTYSCVNCVRAIPYLREWYRRYRDKGLVLIGVHTPEFEFEKSPANVARAVRELGVEWPVVQDNDYAIWSLYANRFWPAHYFIDAAGRVRYFHFGEGNYAGSERIIRTLLQEAGTNVEGQIVSRPDEEIQAQTPEIYLGYDRARGFASAVVPVFDRPAEYRPARVPGNGEWNLAGTWTITPQYVVPESSGSLQLGFQARNVFLVIEPLSRDASVQVSVDGAPSADTADVKEGRLLPEDSRMYQLVGLARPGAHVLRLEVTGKLRLFAFTFG
jgi:cytochrome c biogenesis protein CcdA/thiol-disulfide isomerase/thioredoxin